MPNRQEKRECKSARFARRLRIQNNVTAEQVIPRVVEVGGPIPSGIGKDIFAGIDPNFASRVSRGDILVAGDNFGAGSAADVAAMALCGAGFYAVMAKSFSRVFYRSAFNAGLLLVECDTHFIDDGDEVEVDLDNSRAYIVSKGLRLDMKPLPQIARKLVEDGGLLGHFKKHGGFKFE